MRHKLLDQAAFHRLAQAGRAPAAALQRVIVTRGRVVDEARRAIRFCFSDPTVDRMNDRIFASAWDLRNFFRSPVALWAHDSSQPPIGRAANVGFEGDKLMGDIEYTPPEIYEFGDLIYRLTKDGWINAVSVGFGVQEYTRSNDPARHGGFDFTKVELLEVSAVPVGAQSNALVAAKRMGCSPLQIARLSGGWRKDAQDDGELALPDCGRDEDEECGLVNSDECIVHGPPEAITAAAARRKVKALLLKADPPPPVWRGGGRIAARRHAAELGKWLKR